MDIFHDLEIGISLGTYILETLILIHFIQKRKDEKHPEQLYFILMIICYYIITTVEIGLYIANVDSEVFQYFAYTWFIFLLTAITAAGLSLNLKYSLANLILVLGFSITIYSLYHYFSGDSLVELQEFTFTVVYSLMLPFGGLTILILTYYTYKTRVSSILGLWIAVGFLGVYGVLSHVFAWVWGRNLVRIIMLAVMYAGFKRKLTFFELSTQEKIKQGIPVKIDEYHSHKKEK